MRTPPTEMVSARGEIALWRRGEGPPVLCLHSFPDHPIGLLPMAEYLAAAGYEAIVAGLPGWPPSSTVPDDDYGIPAVAADMLAAMDALGIERFAIVGHGWGAEIGYHLGAHHPERIASLTAIAVPHGAGWATRHRVFTEQQTAAYAYFLAYSPHAAEVASDRTWLTSAYQHWTPGLVREDWGEILDLVARPEVVSVVGRYYRAALTSESAPAPVHVPTTTIHGGQSPVVRPALFDGLEHWFTAGYRRHLVPHVAQWPQLEDPETVLPLILDGVRRPPSAAEA